MAAFQLLLTLLVLCSQNRDTAAMQRKLDEVIAVEDKADNRLIAMESVDKLVNDDSSMIQYVDRKDHKTEDVDGKQT